MVIDSFGIGALPDAAQPGRLVPIPGRVPAPDDPLPGCRFAPRCPFAEPECGEIDPPLAALASGARAACLRAPLEGGP